MIFTLCTPNTCQKNASHSSKRGGPDSCTMGKQWICQQRFFSKVSQCDWPLTLCILLSGVCLENALLTCKVNWCLQEWKCSSSVKKYIQSQQIRGWMDGLRLEMDGCPERAFSCTRWWWHLCHLDLYRHSCNSGKYHFGFTLKGYQLLQKWGCKGLGAMTRGHFKHAEAWRTCVKMREHFLSANAK